MERTTTTTTIASTIATENNLIKRRPIKSWDKDGVSGGPSSLAIVMKWITHPANFSRWEGSRDNNNSWSRESLCSEINRLMMRHGIKHRNNRDIRNRIQNIYYSFKKAQNWIDENEHDAREKLAEKGVPDDQIHFIIKAKVEGIFSAYYTMKPLMNGDYTLEPYDTTITENSGDYKNEAEEDMRQKQQQTPSTPYTQASTPIPQRQEEKMEEPASFKTLPTLTQIKAKSRRTRHRGVKRKGGLCSILSKYVEKKLDMEKKHFEIEKKCFELEKSQAEANLLRQKAETQVAFINAWKSLGLTNEEILTKFDEIWK